MDTEIILCQLAVVNSLLDYCVWGLGAMCCGLKPRGRARETLMPVTRTCGYRRMTWCEVSQPTLNLQLMTMAILVNKQHLFDGQEVGSRRNLTCGGESKREKLCTALSIYL